jgi:hypothetical protein
VAGHLRVPIMPFSHRHLPQRCFWPNLVQAFPVDRLAFYFPVLSLFPVVFCFVCSPCFLVLVFPCIILSLFFLCVFYFYSSTNLLHVSFVALHLLPGFISLPLATNFKCTYQWSGSARTQLIFFFFCISFMLVFVFSLYFCCVFPCNNALASLV